MPCVGAAVFARVCKPAMNEPDVRLAPAANPFPPVVWTAVTFIKRE